MDIMDDVDPMSLAIGQAAEHLRSALHGACGAGVDPQALHARESDLFPVLSRVQHGNRCADVRFSVRDGCGRCEQAVWPSQRAGRH